MVKNYLIKCMTESAFHDLTYLSRDKAEQLAEHICRKFKPKDQEAYIKQLEAENERLKTAEPKQPRVSAIEKAYWELIMAVGNKYKGETRHQTALRYILEAERSNNGEAQTKQGGE